jgi:hypothetical protein
MQGVRGSNPLSSTPDQRPSPPSTARQSGCSRSNRDWVVNPIVQGGGYAGQHCWGRLAVDAAHQASAGAAVAAAARVAYQIVDHPGGDGGVFQPGGEGVPQVMGPLRGLGWSRSGELFRPLTGCAAARGRSCSVAGRSANERVKHGLPIPFVRQNLVGYGPMDKRPWAYTGQPWRPSCTRPECRRWRCWPIS